jgi:hypothetical protein
MHLVVHPGASGIGAVDCTNAVQSTARMHRLHPLGASGKVADARDRLDHLLYDYRSLTSNSQI